MGDRGVRSRGTPATRHGRGPLFPDVSDTPVLKWISGPFLAQKINEFTNWFVDHVDTFTIAFKNDITNWLINPLQDLLAESPWWLTASVLLAVAYVLVSVVAGLAAAAIGLGVADAL